MKASVRIVVSLLVCVVSLDAVAAEEFASVINRFHKALGRSPSLSFKYAGMFSTADDTQIVAEGEVISKSGFRVIADSTLKQGDSNRKHIVRSDGTTLYEAVIANGITTTLTRADLDDIREYFGEDFLPFAIDENLLLQASLLASLPLLESFYEFSFVNTYRISGRELVVYEAAITSELMERAGRIGGNPVVAALTFLASRAGRIWFYFGPDDGLLYRLEIYRRGGGGMFLTAEFSDYKKDVRVDDADFLYDPPAGVEIHKLSDDFRQGILAYNRTLARVPLKPNDRVPATHLTPLTGFPVHLRSFKDAVILILWENVGRDRRNAAIGELNEILAKEVGKPIYCVIVTTRRGETATTLAESVTHFPVVSLGRELEEDPVALSLRLLEASSRVIVVKPGLRVSAVIPCDNPRWPELTRQEYMKVLEEDK